MYPIQVSVVMKKSFAFACHERAKSKNEREEGNSLAVLLSFIKVLSVLSELVEVAGVDVRRYAAALYLYFVGSAAQVDLRGSIAVGLNARAVEACIKLRGSCAPRSQSVAFEVDLTFAGT